MPRKRHRKKSKELSPVQEGSDVKVSNARKERVGVVKNINSPVLGYTFGYSRDSFVPTEYDLSEIGRIEDVENMVRQAFKKKTGLMFKESYDFVGPNIQTVKYVKTRFKQISQASGVSTQTLIRTIGSDLIRLSNAFICKVRDEKASGGKVRVNGSKKRLKPVAAYFTIPAETVEIKRNVDTNQIEMYRQRMPDGRYKEYVPDDIVHIFYDKRPGFNTGKPTIVPVIDDIRALRRIEQNIELLIYQHLFPLFHHKVGTKEQPDRTYQDGTKEVDLVRDEIEFMPSEGSIVTSYRHEVEAIGAESRAIRAEGYLEHFKKRVIAGLGISSMDLGEGDCYDEITETLTEDGWKKHFEITEEEKIATYNPESELVEFHVPNYKYEELYVGDMILVNGKHVDIKVTPHHDMWIKERSKTDSSIWKKVEAQDLLDRSANSEFLILESAEFDVSSKDTRFHLDAADRIAGHSPKPIDCGLDDFAEFLGHFVSEGCIDTHNSSRGHYRLQISQNIGDAFDRICDCLDRTGLSYRTRAIKNRGEQGAITITGKTICKFIGENIGHGSKNKNLPPFVFGWPKSARKALLSSLISGDGTIDKRQGRTSRTYYTASKKLSDDVQTLAMSLGYKAKVVLTAQSADAYGESIYRVLISGDGTGDNYRIIKRSMISRESYSGIIYCYNVPNHLFVTRRNGKVTIQGNTANRATSETMSRAMIDEVKDFQETLVSFFNEFILKELLLEGSFSFDPTEEDNVVHLAFNEIDIDAKIKRENHNMLLYQGHVINETELRNAVGLEPVIEGERSGMFLEIVMKPQAEFQAAASALNAGGTAEGATASAKSKQQPSNQHGTKSGPEKKKSSYIPKLPAIDGVLKEEFADIMSDIERTALTGTFTVDWAVQLLSVVETRMIERLNGLMNKEIRAGLISATKNPQDVPLSSAYKQTEEFANLRIHYLINTIKKIVRQLDGNGSTIIDDVQKIYRSLSFRFDFILRTEKRRAFLYGKALGMKNERHDLLTVVASEGACEDCMKQKGDVINLDSVRLNDMPVAHDNCGCDFE